ncbi:MAG: 4Fe-4S binding protein [Deltaproteobacteria bacterium]|nr:4Fe-4S binding protein [Deltaproteobacteria bacterium]
MVKMVLGQPKPGLVFNSGFRPRIEPEQCTACEVCVGRCPPGAIKMGEDGSPVTDMDRCFGCAVCASGCPEGAIVMEAKPGWPEPPRTTRDLVAVLKAGAGGQAAR